MTRAIDHAVEHAHRTYEGVRAKMERFGVVAQTFRDVSPAYDADSAAAAYGFRAVRDQLAYVFPEWEARGCFSHVPVGVFGLFLARRDGGDPLPTLTATIVLGDHRGLTERELLPRLIDPERRIGLGPWYEVTAAFDGRESPFWSHGFYAHRADLRKRRLDHIWRRHQDLLRSSPRSTPMRRQDILLTALWERIVGRWSF